jgi:hypothetical protein
MPCYYTGSAEGDARLAAEEAQTALTNVTQMLCALMTLIETHHDYLMPDVPSNVRIWWDRHKEIDKKREAQRKREEKVYAARKAARAKLSRAERKLLGID